MLTRQEKMNLKELATVINDAQADCIKRGGKPVPAKMVQADNRSTAIFINKKK